MEKKNTAIVPESETAIVSAEQVKKIYPIIDCCRYSEARKIHETKWYEKIDPLGTGLTFSFLTAILNIVLNQQELALAAGAIGLYGVFRIVHSGVKFWRKKKLAESDIRMRKELELSLEIEAFNTELEKARLLADCADSGLDFEEFGKQKTFEEIVRWHKQLAEKAQRFRDLLNTEKKLEEAEAKIDKTDTAARSLIAARKVEIEGKINDLVRELNGCNEEIPLLTE